MEDNEKLNSDPLADVREQINKMLEDAKKSAEDIVKKAKQEAAKVAKSINNDPTVAVQAPVKKEEEKVYIELFKDNDRYKDDFQCAVNGKTYIIQRGKRILVPKSVAEVIENSMRQDKEAINYMTAKSAEYENSLK
jgi:sensor domain CHASE-containing protein